MEDKRKKMLRYLNDAYASEIGGLASLKDLSMVTTDPEVKQACLDHIQVTQRQAERLTQRILALGGDKSEPKAIVNSVVSKASSFVNIGHDREDKQTQDLIKAVALENFEVGTYTSMYAYAQAIGDLDTAMLADEIREEERSQARRFEMLIPQVAILAVNKTEEMHESRHRGQGQSVGWTKSVAPFLLIPSAALAVWGVSKLLKGSNSQESNFGTARQEFPVMPVAEVEEVVVVETRPRSTMMDDLAVDAATRASDIPERIDDRRYNTSPMPSS